MKREELREKALAILRAALEAVEPGRALKRAVARRDYILEVGQRQYDLKQFDHLYIIGAGKASASMARALEEILGERLKGGLVVVKDGYGEPLRKVRIVEASHPIPDERSLEAGRKLMAFVDAQVREDDLVFCLISGGGSALLTVPQEGITLEDKKAMTTLLLQCGASIEEINAVRKHISLIKGGGLARLVYPAHLISLVVSDVIGDRLDTIASGPTVPDSTTYAEALEVLERHGLTDRTPAPIVEHLKKGAQGLFPETPKEGDAIFEREQCLLIATNRMAMEAALKRAREEGFNAMLLSSSIRGDTEEAALFHLAILEEILSSGNPVKAPACVISGGETTVVVRGKGMGGRNQHFVLRCALGLEEMPKEVLVASLGTDGSDGLTEAAGAMADRTTLERAKERGLKPARDFLNDNDSYHFFQSLQDLIVTGPTKTNVMDIRLLLVD